MARIVKSETAHQAIRIRDDVDSGELLLVGGYGPYLWVGRDKKGDGREGVMTFSGTVTLRKLARKILKIVGDE